MNAPRFSTVGTLNVVSARPGLPRLMATLLLALLAFLPRINAAPNAPATNTSSAPIPLDRIGDTAGKQYQGDGLSVSATKDGARLRCVFQKMEGEVTREGLWLTSTADESKGERFRVVATAVGRAGRSTAVGDEVTRLTSIADLKPEPPYVGSYRMKSAAALAVSGTVEVADKLARFIRPGLVEEYSVSVDGLRQDFIVLQRPGGEGLLRVELDVAGAKAEALVNGARLVLEGSGRKLNYNRLTVVDATGRELTARMEVAADLRGADSLVRERIVVAEKRADKAVRAPMLAVLVDDAAAVYPVRIDPTFSDANWFSMGSVPGANNTVDAAVVDGSHNLYIGGAFTVVGDTVANYIAKWDGSAWFALGSGMDGRVYALALSGTDLYAGGSFTNAGGVSTTNIAKWDGSAWSALGSGVGGIIQALAVSGSNLYAGGGFTTAGGVNAANIAKWDGSAWSALVSGLGGGAFTGTYVSALAVSGSVLYAGGSFNNAGGVSATNIAKWDGTAWSALGSGVNGRSVNALAFSGSDLYAGGSFTNVSGVSFNCIAKWDGSAWSALGSGLGGGDNNFGTCVLALAVSGNDVYVGGVFTTAGGVAANRIAKWDGSAWSALGSGMDAWVFALAVSGNDFYAVGSFTTAGESSANRIAKWDGNSWLALGSGTSGPVVAMTVLGGDLYAGGWFKTVGGVSANRIAKWDGNSWSALGSGLIGVDNFVTRVSALAVSGSVLYAGGSFTNAGGASATNIAKWDGTAWSALGSGVNGMEVDALAVLGSDLYAGGTFTNAGGVSVNCIAKWDGTAWSALGSGVNGVVVSALSVSGSNLYVGGYFTDAGGVSGTTNIAKWDGTAWSALGSGIQSPLGVTALAMSGTDLYVGGGFNMVGEVSANHIAKWDGSAWSALGSGISGGVQALVVSGSDLYVGGDFTTAGGVAANRIAKWDGNAWSAFGSGVSGGSVYLGDSGFSSAFSFAGTNVFTLAVLGNNLYAGGFFTVAGGTVAAYMARAYLLSIPHLSILRTGPNVILSWPSPDTASFMLEQTPTLATPASWIANTTSVTDDGTNKSATVPATNSHQFFRLRKP